MKRKIISIFLAALLIIATTVPTYAETAQERLDELEQEKEQTEQEKDQVTSEKNDILDEIYDLDSQISVYENKIDALNSEIEELEDSIDKKEDEIKKLEKEAEEKKEILIKRLIAIYEAGQTTYLDVLLSSEDMVSFISNYYMIEQLADADQSVIDSINEKQEEIENVKKELEDEKKEVAEARKEVETENNKLIVAKASKQVKVDALSEKEQELQEKLDAFEEAIEEAKEEIKREVQSSSGYVGSFEGDLSWPLSANSDGYNHISSIFGHRDQPTWGASEDHGAVDIPVYYAPVYAPASGLVIIARELSGYGNYILIDHGNGYYTGFAHLSAYNVSKGDVVSRGQQIAVSGNTGITTGPHLHYEVHIGGYDQSDRVDPLLYTSHPDLIFY